jgi:hypothetical protein
MSEYQLKMASSNSSTAGTSNPTAPPPPAAAPVPALPNQAAQRLA